VWTLSPRLRTIADLVRPGARLADIGTDHARLPVWLIRQGVISRAIATDLRPGPLERARQTAARCALEGQIDFRLGDGLQTLSGPEEADTLVVAGMGGETIAAILSGAPWLASPAAHTCRLLLQPMSGADALRRWLGRNGFAIRREVLCQEERTLYVILWVERGEMPPLTPAQCWAGRQCADALRGVLLDRLIRRAELALDGIRQSVRPSDQDRRAELEQVCAGLRDMKEEWSAWQL